MHFKDAAKKGSRRTTPTPRRSCGTCLSPRLTAPCSSFPPRPGSTGNRRKSLINLKIAQTNRLGPVGGVKPQLHRRQRPEVHRHRHLGLGRNRRRRRGFILERRQPGGGARVGGSGREEVGRRQEPGQALRARRPLEVGQPLDGGSLEGLLPLRSENERLLRQSQIGFGSFPFGRQAAVRGGVGLVLLGSVGKVDRGSKLETASNLLFSYFEGKRDNNIAVASGEIRTDSDHFFWQHVVPTTLQSNLRGPSCS